MKIIGREERDSGTLSLFIGAMVVKTELCAFSEFRIYPGHGIRFIRRDGQPILLSSSKCKSMVNQRKKPAKLMWTQAWRRLNKKGKEEGVVRKKSRKAAKVQRAIMGTSIDDLLKKRQATKPKSAEAVKEVKEKVKKDKKAAGPKPTGANIPKIQQTSRANARGGSRR